MGAPKRRLQATAEETLTPPDALSEGQHIARVTKGAGNNLYHVELSDKKQLLVELPARFRSSIWIKRNGYLLVDTTLLADRDNKLDGEIVNVVREEKQWRKMTYWPKEFVKSSAYDEDSEDEGPKMPTDDEEDDET
ncbi:hypothetical protein LTS18_003587 [Coniosporium uncinatum]|uniref:Uncharacterized protein n=1 Tax=Coniosporium uncinatum TaxID=93489 RepID=A0ACC3DTD4_9PEZI|nr:hypothetical protein LTS18_003587 [Coniosporium uncinatum]